MALMARISIGVSIVAAVLLGPYTRTRKTASCGLELKVRASDSFDTVGWYQKLCNLTNGLARHVGQLKINRSAAGRGSKIPVIGNAAPHELRLVISIDGGLPVVSVASVVNGDVIQEKREVPLLASDPISAGNQEGRAARFSHNDQQKIERKECANHPAPIVAGSGSKGNGHGASTPGTSVGAGTKRTPSVKSSLYFDPDIRLGVLINRYCSDDYPNGDFEPREKQRTHDSEAYNCVKLFEFYHDMKFSDFRTPELFRHRKWRRKQIQRGPGNRTVQLEWNTLKNVLKHAVNCGLIKEMPAVRFPSLRSRKNIRHARDCMPANIDVVHKVCRKLFTKRRSQAVGWQALLATVLSLRTIEILNLRMNAGPEDPGWVSADKTLLLVSRAKNQENNHFYVTITPEIALILKAHRAWHKKFFPNSPWYLPSPQNPANHLSECALTRALDRLWKEEPRLCGHKITSHGLRALYISIRLDQGASPYDVAREVGHTSGGSTIIESYDGRLPRTVLGVAPLSFKPEGEVAWNELDLS
jgi:hypothetical protein